MKIVSVECLVLDGDFPFVKVHTDEGITGIGAGIVSITSERTGGQTR